MRRTLVLGMAVSLFSAAPAARACDTGPWFVDFVRGTPELTSDGAYSVDGLVAMRGRQTVRIVIYNPNASALWKRRIETVRRRLMKAGVQPSSIEFVPVKTQNGMVAGYWHGRATRMTGQLVKGCGG